MRNEELLLLVGKLNYTWTNTESLLIYVMAHLMRTSKDVAIVTFLTLNTSRARLDFIDRLCKLKSTDRETRERLATVVIRMKSAARMRNKYNHCIYSFDQNGKIEGTQLLRIADYRDKLAFGKMESIDSEEIVRINESISEIVSINKYILNFCDEMNVSL